jgi:pSer/pThr/pTyr-binding forkhead associated (FHA) protein
MGIHLLVTAPEPAEISLQPGDPCRIGSEPSLTDLCVPDKELSAVHCIIECDVLGGQIRDLRGKNGTFVNGERVTTPRRLKDGDRITAGTLVIEVQIAAASGAKKVAVVEDTAPAVVEVEPEAPPAQEEPLDDSPAARRERRLLMLLTHQPSPLFAVLDAAANPDILQMIGECGEESRSLLVGENAKSLIQFAPYLVAFPKDSKLLPKVVKSGWGNSWGVFLTSGHAFMDIFYHIRHFLTANLPTGKQLYFRFYDPRVLRLYLPSCTPQEGEEFFGPISTVLMEAEDPAEALEFAILPQGLHATPHPLVKDPEKGYEPLRAAYAAQSRPLGDREDQPKFILRDEQLAVLERAAIKDFILRMESFIRDNHPEAVEGMKEETVRRRLVFGMRRAKTYGLTQENAVTAFVTLMFVIAPNFDEQPNINKVLRDDKLSPDERVIALTKETRAEHWDQAQQNARPAMWELAG